MTWGIIALVAFLIFVFVAISAKNLAFICPPNEVIIISGRGHREGIRRFGYGLVKGGLAVRIPLFERIDRMDLTNMVIDISATNAYCRGGIPLTVQGVANVKIAGHEPVLNNAIERFLGRTRMEIMQIAKATLEGSLRGILSTMTPEEVNEDKIMFAERLVHEVEADMTALGLVVDTMKIQNVHDEVKYLDSIGRKRSAEVVCSARIAEAKARADSVVREAENRERATLAQINGQIEYAKADAQRRLIDATTRRSAVVAEEQSTVAGLVAQASADLSVQSARVEQTRRKLEADVIAPAKAGAEVAEARAKAISSPIIEEGRAKADALRSLADSWNKAGSSARQVAVLQKLNPIIESITNTISSTEIEKVTMIDKNLGQGNAAIKALPALEQIKQVFGIDVVEKLKALGEKAPVPAHQPPPVSE